MKRKVIIISIITVAVILIASALCVAIFYADKQTQSDAENIPYYLHPGYEVISVGTYSGEFVEDGSDRTVNNVCMITVKNNTSDNIKLLEIQAVDTEGEVYDFVITTLLINSQVTVLEKNAKTADSNIVFEEFTVIRSVEFTENVSVHSEKFEITAMDSVFNIRNISAENYENPVYVYYKNKSEKGYFGGITYRAKVNSLKSGELMQIPASHFDIDNSEVLFVSFTS